MMKKKLEKNYDDLQKIKVKLNQQNSCLEKLHHEMLSLNMVANRQEVQIEKAEIHSPTMKNEYVHN